jgi:hypothetical protein
MKKTLLVLLLGSFAIASSASATDRYFIFKAAATITVNRVDVGATVDKIVTKTLAGNDLINLTLARPLGSKVDATTAILAVAVVMEGPGTVAAPKSKLVIFNPDPNVVGAAKITTVATLSNLDFDLATLTKTSTGQGIAEVNFPETTTGDDPANNKFFATTLNGSGQGTVPKPAVMTNIDGFAFALKSVSGQLHIKYKLASKPADPPADFDWTVMKGMLKTTVKPITFLDL